MILTDSGGRSASGKTPWVWWPVGSLTLSVARPGNQRATRLAALRAMLKEEEGLQGDISVESLLALHIFLQRAGAVKPPEITLTPEAEVYLRWKAGRNKLFAVHLVNGRMVRYAVFAPNPRHPRLVRRLSGIEAADTVLVKTATQNGIGQ